MASTPTSSSPGSQSTSMTTPPAISPGQQEQSPNAVDENDTSDIWASDSPPPTLSHQQALSAPTPELSDLPSLRRQHITFGYREGLSVGKAKVIQSAFDQGYPLGISLGLRVGMILGALEGLLATPSVRDVKGERKRVEDVLNRTRRELDVKNLLAGVEEESVASVESVEALEGVEDAVKKWENEVLGVLEACCGRAGDKRPRSERVDQVDQD